MTTVDVLLSAWDWEPSVVTGCLALAAAYLVLLTNSRGAGTRTCGAETHLGTGSPWQNSRQAEGPPHPLSQTLDRGWWGRRYRLPFRLWSAWANWKAATFLFATFLLLFDLVSPIDTLGDSYLFSAHVIQHFLLALIIPPLWLLGTPRAFASALLRYRRLRATERALSRPSIAWPLGVSTMLLWHVPLFFNAALALEPLHIFQHLSFLVTGTIFWWPILSPLSERRLPAFSAIAYLFSACTVCSLLGAVLTFSPPGAYPAYFHPKDSLGLLPLIRRGWGIDPATDQQLGGMLMWVPGCLVYLAAILATVARWYATPERVASEPV